MLSFGLVSFVPSQHTTLTFLLVLYGTLFCAEQRACCLTQDLLGNWLLPTAAAELYLLFLQSNR